MRVLDKNEDFRQNLDPWIGISNAAPEKSRCEFKGDPSGSFSNPVKSPLHVKIVLAREVFAQLASLQVCWSESNHGLTPQHVAHGPLNNSQD